MLCNIIVVCEPLLLLSLFPLSPLLSLLLFDLPEKMLLYIMLIILVTQDSQQQKAVQGAGDQMMMMMMMMISIAHVSIPNDARCA